MSGDAAVASNGFHGMSLRRLLVALPFAATLGCGTNSSLTPDPAEVRIIETGIELALDKATYGRGELVRVTMTNRTSRNYGFNLCTRTFERLEDDRWVAMPPELRLCTMQIDGLSAGAVRTQGTDLHGDAGPGVYRMLVSFTHMMVERPQTHVMAASAPFTIQ